MTSLLVSPRMTSVASDVANIDVESVAAAVHDAIVTTVFPVQARESGFDAALTRCVRGNVCSIVDIASGRLSVAEADPGCALSFAALVAELAIPLGTLERAYWVGVERFWQEWLTLAKSGLAEGNGNQMDAVADPTAAVFPYVRRVLDLIGARHDEVARERARSGEDRRRALVEDLLDGSVTQYGQELDNALGYRLRGSHVALLFESGRRTAVRRTLTRLVEQTGACGSFVVQRDASSWSTWLGYTTTPERAKLRVLRQALSRLDEPVAIGGPAPGLGGFRQSHDEACRAAALRPVLVSPPDPLWYADVRLEAFLLDDPRSAHRFVVEELCELADDNERAHRIRATLLAALATGSQARAAAELGVHENTVRLRIRSATEVLGDNLAERRTELLVALRLRHALGAPGGAEAAAVRAAG